MASLINMISGTPSDVVPTLGMGATELCYSDRHAYTVTKIVNEKTIEVTRDTATRTDRNGQSECQDWTFAPNPNGAVQTLRRGRDGQWRAASLSESGRWTAPKSATRYALGHRDEYYDPSF